MTFFTQGITYKSTSTNIPPQTSHWQPPAVVLPSTPQYDGTLILTIRTYDSADMFFAIPSALFSKLSDATPIWPISCFFAAAS